MKIKPDFFEAVDSFYVYSLGESLNFKVVYLKDTEYFAYDYVGVDIEVYIALFIALHITLFIIVFFTFFKYYINEFQ